MTHCFEFRINPDSCKINLKDNKAEESKTKLDLIQETNQHNYFNVFFLFLFKQKQLQKKLKKNTFL